MPLSTKTISSHSSLSSNIRDVLRAHAQQKSNCVALVYRDDQNKEVFWTWSYVLQLVELTAETLWNENIREGARVGIALANKPYWEILHWALLWNGAQCIGLDLHGSSARNLYIIENSELNFIFEESTTAMAHAPSSSFSDLIQNSKTLAEKVKVLDGTRWFYDIESKLSNHSFLDFNPPLQTPLGELIATHIYTSGTTGNPKKYTYTQGQLFEAVNQLTMAYSDFHEKHKLVSWLPLSNLFQRITNLSGMSRGCATYFVANPSRIIEELAWIKPHCFISVPRFYEKIYENIQAQGGIPPLILTLSEIYHDLKRNKLKRRYLLAPLQKIFDFFIFRKIRNIFGGQLLYAISGSAPLRKELLYFYHACGLPIFEAYGMSENILPVCVSNLTHSKFGSVGRPLIPEGLKISDKNEVLVRNFGLHQNAPLVDGWFVTGDIGTLDEEGYLYLKGRQSDFVKTSTGKRIASLPIEVEIKKLDFVEHALLIGDEQKYLSALITLIPGTLEKTDPIDLQNQLKKHIQIINGRIELPILGAIVLSDRFTAQSGDLTENLKVKRNAILAKYDSLIKKLSKMIDLHAVNHRSPNYQSIEILLGSLIEARETSFLEEPVLNEIKDSLSFRSYQLIKFGVNVFPYILFLKIKRLSPDLQERIKLRIAHVVRSFLGPLKGPLLKVGQIISMLPGVFPTLAREILIPLRTKAEILHFDIIKKCVENELGSPLSQYFSEFSKLPIASSSIGQIHRAQLHSGEHVVIKVKYPNVEKIISTDLKLIKVLAFLAKYLSPIQNALQIETELQTLLKRETNFIAEAQTQEKIRLHFRHRLDLVVPKVFLSLSTKSVLTTEFIQGINYETFLKDSTYQARQSIAKSLWTYAAESINYLQLFNADPHPDNFIFVDAYTDHPRLALLDFGFFVSWNIEFIKIWQRQTWAAMNLNLEEFQKSCYQLNIFENPQDPRAETLMNLYYNVIYSPWRESRVFKFDKSFLQKELSALSKYHLDGESINIPAEFIGVFRLYWGIHILMAELEGEANWYQESIHFILSTIREFDSKIKLSS